MSSQIADRTTPEECFRPCLMFNCAPARWHSWLATSLFDSSCLKPTSSLQRTPSIAQLAKATLEFYVALDVAQLEHWSSSDRAPLLWRVIWKEIPFGNRPNWVSGRFDWDAAAFLSSWPRVVVEVSCYPHDRPPHATTLWTANGEALRHISLRFFDLVSIP